MISRMRVYTTVGTAKAAEPIEMPFGGRLRWAQGTTCRADEGARLAPTGEYGESICATAAMRTVANVTVATCLYTDVNVTVHLSMTIGVRTLLLFDVTLYMG